MRLDADDPVAAWREHAAMLERRAAGLDEARFDAVRFRGPGTDLVVGLLPASRWMCATFETATGIGHLPNIPTEEVFTTPDWRRTEGTVRSTYPLVVPGVVARVDGLELRFEGGKIVDVSADGDGADVIRGQLASDAQAPYLGEVALVDGASRVRQTGSSSTTRSSTRTPPATSRTARAADGGRGGGGARAEELLELGVNVSAVAHGLHDRRRRGRGRRPRRRRDGDADHPRRRLGALSSFASRIRQEPDPAA